MKQFFAARTKGFRYRLVKYLAPSIGEMLETNFRPMIHFLKTRFGDAPLVGVEIGVGSGINALNILDNLNMKRLYLIDPYKPYVQGNRRISGCVKSFSLAHKRLGKFKNVRWIKKKSWAAIDYIPFYVDFVYVDGNRNYKNVLEDITLYYPKVKEGGVIGGHGFAGLDLGIPKAVIEFVTNHDLKSYGLLEDWWVVKHEILPS